MDLTSLFDMPESDRDTEIPGQRPQSRGRKLVFSKGFIDTRVGILARATSAQNMSLILLGTKQKTQWALFCGVLLLFAGLLIASLLYERQRVTVEQFERLASKTRVVEENMVRQLAGVDALLKAALQGAPAFSPTSGNRGAADPFLGYLASSSVGVRTVFLLDSEGRVVAASRDQLVGVDFSAREYFTTPKQFPAPDVLYLSQPFRTILGVYSMNAVRVLVNAQGKVEQMAAATLDPEFFEVLLSSVIFEPDVQVALTYIDGSLFLHNPPHPEWIGKNLRQANSLFSRHVESGSVATVMAGTTVIGTEMWMAQRTIAAQELNMAGALVVGVGRDPAVALAPWRTLVAAAVVIWALVATLSGFALVLFQRYQGKEDERLAQADALRRQAEEETRQLAYYDALTALPNRRLLSDRMMQMQSASRRHRRLSALVFLDLDGFKQLNDSLGHDAGDLLLKEVGRRLTDQIRQEDTASRWAGDEFAVALADLGTDAKEAGERAMAVAQKILTSLAQPYDLAGIPYRCTASAGVALFGSAREPLEAVFKRADEAMYRAKTSGRNKCNLFVYPDLAQEIRANGTDSSV